jgi:FMN phosphatase YigB (HAD superfamily)
VGLRKPEVMIYQVALEVTQKLAQDTCFIDDRALNLDTARQLGMQTIEMAPRGAAAAGLAEAGSGNLRTKVFREWPTACAADRKAGWLQSRPASPAPRERCPDSGRWTNCPPRSSIPRWPGG